MNESISYAIKEIDFEQFTSYLESLKHPSFLKGIIYGNISQDDAKTVLDRALVLQTSSRLKKRSRAEEVQEKASLIKLESPLKGQLALSVIDYGEPSPQNVAIQRTLDCLDKHFLEKIRYEYELAYDVHSKYFHKEGRLYHCFEARSDKNSAQKLLVAFELFFADISKNLSEENFEMAKEQAFSELENAPTSIEAMGELLRRSLFDFGLEIGQRKEQLQAVSELSFEAFKAQIKVLLSPDRKKIAAMILGKLSEENNCSRKITETRARLSYE